MDTVAARSPVRVDWDELTLDQANSPLSVAVELDNEAPEVIEQDCTMEPLFLRVPVSIRLVVDRGGIEGRLVGELRATPDGAITVSAEGPVEANELWTELGEAHVRERHGGVLESWQATILRDWDGATLGIDASGTDADGDGLSTALWRGHWVLDAGTVP